MEANTNTRKLHPLVAAAAVSVMVFSAVGVAAITGLIPHSKGDEQPPVAAVETPAPQTESMPAAAPVATPPAPVKKHVAKAHRPATPPAQVAYAETPALTPPPPPAAAPQYVEAKPAVKPGVYGVVESVREVEVKGDAKGVGAVGGALAGAVLGHNIGDHNKLVTVLGAAGGGLLGNQIEKQARATKHWELTVRYDDGSTQTFNSDTQPFWHQGDRVRYYEGKLQPV